MIDNLLVELAGNKIFTGCVLLMTNIGGRYLSIDFPKNLDSIFTQYFVLRCLVLFSVFFMATRDIKISLLLSLLFFIVIYFFINEKSSFCIVKEQFNNKNNNLNSNINNLNSNINNSNYTKNNLNNNLNNNKITLEEYNKAKEIIRKYQNA
jgi:hypothetical protein